MNTSDVFRERCFQFSIQIIRFLQVVPKNYIFEVIGKQLIRSVTSIGANVTEGKSASSRKDFINFLSYALKSANETTYWLRIIIEIYPIKKDEVQIFLQESQEITKILGASIVTLKRKKV